MAALALVGGFLTTLALLMVVLDRLEPDAEPGPRPRPPRRRRCSAGRPVQGRQPGNVTTRLCCHAGTREQSPVPVAVPQRITTRTPVRIPVRIPGQRSGPPDGVRTPNPGKTGGTADAVPGVVFRPAPPC